MLKKFRRSSKASTTSATPPSSRHGSVATTISTKTTTSSRTKTNFFSLPAELRNQIYNLAAKGIVLRLLDRKSQKLPKRRKTTIDTVPSLFITSRQCRSEYLPILLSTAKIEVQVIDFDFSNIIRIIGSLYCTELKSLRLNPNLMLALSFTPRSSDKLGIMEANLRRWAAHRSQGLDRLPWRYRLGAKPDSSVFVVSYHRCMAVLKMVKCKVEEGLGWELQRIMDVVEIPNREGNGGPQMGAEYHEFERGVLWDSAVGNV
ncbi:hypothetical protein HII31_09807 [Pseudocercospora fuligena]|uniref:Uncharacterized protein n=1 Tax=Pseudocercospora fuligena TaxID=685502 RepID=A0A8H6RDE3_9PEZI|nr:hypothetical protein HII31_09807 [Pseudocercospora fuligena]